MAEIPSKRVFVSSTTKDLWQYRKEAAETIARLSDEYKGRFQLVEVTMDTEGQDGERAPAVERSRAWVEEADWIVLIVAWNYGYVAPGEPCSVTEWEYRQAISDPSKLCFVYLAGETADGEKEYRPLKRERENLARWKERGMVPDAHWTLLEQFKKELRDGGSELFSDLDDFLTLLRKSLKNQIERELSPGDVAGLRYDAELLAVLNDLTRQVRCCMDEVRLLVNLKQIHDRLHKIRQFGIRRWREEVLTQWQEGALSGEAQATYLKGLIKVHDCRGTLDGFLAQLPDQARLLKEDLRKVLDTGFEEDPQDRLRFQREAELYAARVQRAFTDSNAAMLERANVLGDCRLSYVGKPGRRPLLRRADEDRLMRDMATLEDGHRALQALLLRHNEWQRMHDGLETIDNARNSAAFADEIDNLLDGRSRMDGLLAEAGRMDLAGDAADKLCTTIAAVQRHLEALAQTRGDSDYERMRKAFDDLFYAVDEKTLEAVKAAETRATQHYQALLDLVEQVQARLPDYRPSAPDQPNERSTRHVAP